MQDKRPLPARLLSTFKRFPYPVFVSAAGTTAALLLVDAKEGEKLLLKIIAVCLLALPLFISSKVLSEKQGRSGGMGDHFLSLLIAVTAMGYFFCLGDLEDYGTILRHVLWSVASYLLLLLFPFYRRDEEETAWHFNASLVQAFSLGAAWAIVLFLGLSAALAGINYLFAVKVPPETYTRLWVVMTEGVGVIVFLSAVPIAVYSVRYDLRQLKRTEGFLRFVLVPLVCLYLMILYAYAGKIIVATSWPKGGVAGFILGFSAVGIISYLLLYPFQKNLLGNLTTFFLKRFFPLLIPLSCLLFLAVWRRVSDYGITESRYWGIASAFWLGGLALYFTFSPRKDRRIIPASVFCIALAASFGPWGVLSISERSQVARLNHILERAGLLTDGHLKPGAKAPDLTDQWEVSQIVSYLHKIGRIDAVIDLSGGKIGPQDPPAEIMQKIGMVYRPDQESRRSFYFYSVRNNAVDIDGFDLLWEFNLKRGSESVTPFEGKIPLQFILSGGLRQVRVVSGKIPVATLDFGAFSDALLAEYPDKGNSEVPRERMRLNSGEGERELRVMVTSINGSIENKKATVNEVSGLLLLKTGHANSPDQPTTGKQP